MRLGTVLAVVTMMAAPSARAQEEVAPPENAWGTSWTSTTTIGAWSFVGPMTDGGNGYRDCTAATGGCRAAVDIPTGVLVWNLEIDGCDSSATEEAVARLWACGPAPGPGTCAIAAEVRSGIAAVPGCGRFRANASPQFTINNYNYTYFTDVFGTDGAANVPVHFRGVRIAALRQVSAAPATATFTDVPTSHPYFRYVEALTGP